MCRALSVSVWLSFIATFLPVPIQAADKLGFSGPGSLSCAQFAEAYRSSPEQMENFFFAWAQGFIAAFSTLMRTAIGQRWDIGETASSRLNQSTRRADEATPSPIELLPSIGN